MGERYLPDLTREENMLIADFLKGKQYVTEVDIDNFMRAEHKESGLFEMCDCRITNKVLIIKRPIGWSE